MENKSLGLNDHSKYNAFENQTIVSISMGYNHSAALTSNGRLFIWGSNHSKQLGDGTEVGWRVFPIDITQLFDLTPGESIAFVSLGASHSSAITSSSRLFMWGDNFHGQLGDCSIVMSQLSHDEFDAYLDSDDYSIRLNPIDITPNFNLYDEERLIQTSLGLNRSVALTSLGRLFMWGSNEDGELGDGRKKDTSVPLDISLLFKLVNGEKIKLVKIADSFSIALTSLNRLFYWGNRDRWRDQSHKDDPEDVTSFLSLTEGETISEVSGQSHKIYVLTSSGRILVVQTNGGGTGFKLDTPIVNNITKKFNLRNDEIITSISLGGTHNAVLTSLGRLFLWGINESGQLGDGSLDYREDPVDITTRFKLPEGESISAISLGGQHSSVITTLGRIFMWGENFNGELGDGTNKNRLTPFDISNNSISWEIVSGWYHLPLSFILKFKDYLHWDLVCSKTKLPLDLIYELIGKVDLSKLGKATFYSSSELENIKLAKRYIATTPISDLKKMFRFGTRNQVSESYASRDGDSAIDEIEYSYSLGLLFLEKEMLPFTDITKLIEIVGEHGLYNERAFIKRGSDSEETLPTYFVNSTPQAVQSHQVIEFDWSNATEYRQVKVHYVNWSTRQPVVGSIIYTGKHGIMVIPQNIPLECNLILRGGTFSVPQVESQEIDNDIFMTPINELAVSDKLKNELVSSGFKTVGDLMQTSEEKIHSIKGLRSKSTKSYAELESAMIELGLGLRKPVAYVISSQISTMDIHQVINESKGVLANEIDWQEFLNYHRIDSLAVIRINSIELKKYIVYDLLSLDGIADVHNFDEQIDPSKVLALLEEYKSQNLIAVPIFIAEV